jgi:hypothetical protein
VNHSASRRSNRFMGPDPSMDKRNFRFLYRFFSSHAHSGPAAFYRMAEHGRGMGFQNPKDTVYMAMALEFAGDLMHRAIADVLVFFPDAETRGAMMRLPSHTRRPVGVRDA